METQPSKITAHITPLEAKQRMSYWDRVCQNPKTSPERRAYAQKRCFWWNKALLKMYMDGTKFSDASEDKVA